MRTCLLFCLTFAISFAGRAEPVPDAAKVLNETFWESADYLAAGDPNPYEIDHRLPLKDPE